MIAQKRLFGQRTAVMLASRTIHGTHLGTAVVQALEILPILKILSVLWP